MTDDSVEVAGTDDTPRPNEAPVQSVEEIALAVDRREVTFPMVIKALYLQWSEDLEPHLRQRYQDLYRPALEQFMAAHGGIRESFYADDFTAGVVLTGSGELFSTIWWDEFKFDTAPARTLEAELNDLRMKAWSYLSDAHRRLCTSASFGSTRA